MSYLTRNIFMFQVTNTLEYYLGLDIQLSTIRRSDNTYLDGLLYGTFLEIRVYN